MCMIGRSRSMYNASNFEPSVVLKLNYLKWSSIYDSLIIGSLESVVSDKDDGENSFDAIMVLAFSVKHSYGFTFVGEDRMSSFPSSVESGESIGASNIQFCMVQDFRTSWDIKATPTFFFLRDGQQVD
ncbi:hypothetical protein ACLB2K_059556 [Fragaria x ananassa]